MHSLDEKDRLPLYELACIVRQTLSQDVHKSNKKGLF